MLLQVTDCLHGFLVTECEFLLRVWWSELHHSENDHGDQSKAKGRTVSGQLVLGDPWVEQLCGQGAKTGTNKKTNRASMKVSAAAKVNS